VDKLGDMLVVVFAMTLHILLPVILVCVYSSDVLARSITWAKSTRYVDKRSLSCYNIIGVNIFNWKGTVV